LGEREINVPTPLKGGSTMRKIFLLGVLLIFLPTMCSAQREGGSQDEKAVKQVMQQWLDSFEKRDANLRNVLLTEDTVFINAFGVQREGKENVSAFWKELFATGTFDQSKVTITQEKIRFLRPEVAIVDRFEKVSGQLGPETGKSLPPRNIHLTFILTKTGKSWLVAYYRGGDLRDPETGR
jgi:uncharacterized protein (TIGR02246 family)